MLAEKTAHRPTVNCETCHRVIFDGETIKSRVVLVEASGLALAKCRCKRWVRVPLAYFPFARR